MATTLPIPHWWWIRTAAPIGTWDDFEIGTTIDLDNAYSKIVERQFGRARQRRHLKIYQANAVSFPSRADFALSAKVTRITPDTQTSLSFFDLRGTIVHAESELLELTSGPLRTPAPGAIAASLTLDSKLLAPIEGSVIGLDRLISPLKAGSKIILSGKLLRVRVAANLINLKATAGPQTRTVMRGQLLTLIARPTLLLWSLVSWTLRTDDGFEGTVTTSQSLMVFTPAHDADPFVSELAVIKECAGDPTVLTLESSLAQLYDRATVTLAANIATATHGETVSEVLGSGDGAQPNQSFKLKQAPALTYTRSTEPGGAASTLQIRVNDLLWQEVPTLFERGPRERIFTTELADDGKVTVRFRRRRTRGAASFRRAKCEGDLPPRDRARGTR